MPSPGETRLMCREVRRWRVVGGGTLKGRKMDRGSVDQRGKAWVWPPPNAGEVAIYGSQAGKDDAGLQLTQLIDGPSLATHRQTPHIRQFYGTNKYEENDHLSAALLYTIKVDADEINESILRLFRLRWPIECDRSHTDATRGPRNTD